MSRVGKKVIIVPSNVTVSFNAGTCTVKGPKGTLTCSIDETITPSQNGSELSFHRANDEKDVRAKHGLTRATVAWMVEGVSNGFTRALQLEGVGYKAELRGKRLLLSLGYSHPILIIPPDGIEFAVTSPTAFSVNGIDKQLVGEIASRVRKLRPPEPYKGKGVRYVGEYIRRKAGKSAGK
jgi:large subunit ribosomal protein L6